MINKNQIITKCCTSISHASVDFYYIKHILLHFLNTQCLFMHTDKVFVKLKK